MDTFVNTAGTGKDDIPIQQVATRTIGRSVLINCINYLNFQDKQLVTIFRHKNYDQTVAVKVKPDPCSGEKCHCSWNGTPPAEFTTGKFILDHINLDDGMSTFSIVPDNFTLDNDGFHMVLPETGVELVSRRIRRHRCSNIRVQMVQNGMVYKGSLVDFTPESFGITMEISTLHSMELLNPDSSLSVTFIRSQQIVYSGECRIARQFHKGKRYTIILQPLSASIRKFKSQKERFERVCLVPDPTVVFQHPLTGKPVNLIISDVSGSGLSVEEDLHTSSLLPGMIIPQAHITFSATIKIACSLQVVYRKLEEEKVHETSIKTGFCFLNMPPEDHVQMMSIIFQAQNKNLFFGKEIDSDSFWQFIFETGFIYPAKYQHLHTNKSELKKIYRRIYSHTPEVIKHITYQEKGRILGHVAMLRVYENAWMLHHHASSLTLNHHAGVAVMGPVADYAYSAHRIPALHLDYLMVYYRPENRFPSKVFGGFSRTLDNPKGCSEDEFAYVDVSLDKDLFFDETDMTVLCETTSGDLVELEGFYDRVSGGLMLEAMDILPEASHNKDLKETYEREHLKRDVRTVSLRKENELLALFLLDTADMGINMSDLSNSIKAFVVKPEKLSGELFMTTLHELARQYYNESTRALIYPSGYAEEAHISYEKKYRLWTFGLGYSDDYYRYIKRLLRIGRKNEKHQ